LASSWVTIALKNWLHTKFNRQTQASGYTHILDAQGRAVGAVQISIVGVAMRIYENDEAFDAQPVGRRKRMNRNITDRKVFSGRTGTFA
jgi:hypothetical protein